MIELRKDYLLDNYVIISKKRGKRPHEFKSNSVLTPGKIDFFAPGNEHLTPPEIGRVQKNGKWIMRWFANKFAAVGADKYQKETGKTITRSMPAYGFHEVIVETRSKTKQLWDLDKNHIEKLLYVYKNRIEELSKEKHIKYVQIFKNHGKEGGTSLIHSHTQVVALPTVPSSVKEKKKAIRKTKTNYKKILNAELKTKRKAINSKHFAAICPYASKFNFELLILPKKNYYSLTDMPKEAIKDLASVLEKALKKLRKHNWSYNFHVHYDPTGKDMHFHIEITPRLATWAGFEHSTGIIINSVDPDDAAAFYRSK